MTIKVRPFSLNDSNNWDVFCDGSLQATLLHTRRFLSYHGDRFTDLSLIIEEDENCVGLFPAALSLSESTVVVSHPGITYGGVLHRGGLRGEKMIEALATIKRYYASYGFEKLIYKSVPIFYHQSPAQDDLYALFRLGARRIRCDLSCTIDLQHRLFVSERRRRSLKKAIKAGVHIVEGHQHLSKLWDVLIDNLINKYGVRPVHSLLEIQWLAEAFPHQIQCVCGCVDNEVIAGVVLFITPTTYHAQYIASTTKGYEISALDRVFEHCIHLAMEKSKRWFDFGISNEDQGKILNKNLYKFKTEFGGGGMVHEFYELSLVESD